MSTLIQRLAARRHAMALGIRGHTSWIDPQVMTMVRASNPAVTSARDAASGGVALPTGRYRVYLQQPNGSCTHDADCGPLELCKNGKCTWFEDKLAPRQPGVFSRLRQLTTANPFRARTRRIRRR